MKLVTIGLFIAVVLSFVLASCGKPVCEQRTKIMGQATSPRLEELRCPDGQHIQPPVTTKQLLNGDIVSFGATCVRVVEVCK